MRANGSYNGKLPLEMSDERDKGFDIGAVLRQARSERGLSLEEVQEATKIRVRYLEGLEREDYDVLPAAVYVRGFLKTYANYLGLDGEELIQELQRQQMSEQDYPVTYRPLEKGEFEEPFWEPEDFGSSSAGPRIFGGTTLVLAVVALALLVGILYFIGRGSQTSTEPNPSPPGENAQAAPGDASKKEPEQDPPSSGDQPPGEAPSEDQSSDEEPSGGEPSEKPSGGQPSGNADSDAEDPAPESGEEPADAPAEPETLEVKISVEGGISWLQIEVDGTTEMAQVARSGFSKTFEAENKIIVNTGNAGAVQAEVNGQNIGALGGSGEVRTREWTLKPDSTSG